MVRGTDDVIRVKVMNHYGGFLLWTKKKAVLTPRNSV